jgi:hypothetical protein
VEAKRKYKECNARFLDPSVEPSVVIRIYCQLNSTNKVFYKTPFIDCMRSARYFLITNDKFKKRRIGNSKTAEDKVCTFNYFCTLLFVIMILSILNRRLNIVTYLSC